jgi:hypothetical protein
MIRNYKLVDAEIGFPGLDRRGLILSISSCLASYGLSRMGSIHRHSTVLNRVDLRSGYHQRDEVCEVLCTRDMKSTIAHDSLQNVQRSTTHC